MSDIQVRIQAVQTGFTQVKTAFGKLERSIGKVKSAVFSLKVALVGAGTALLLKKIGTSTIATAASFEQLELKLNALTKGKGKETLEALNKWALEMPVNTQKAVDTFALMQAFGLDPTIEKMETLVDVAVLFGEDAMPRIARALGQMRALGKLSAEELNQLSEVGINAREILFDTFGMTVEELQKQNVEVDKVIEALMAGMKDKFGGAARAGMTSWQGLKASFQSYITEIQRQVADAGVFGALKQQLAGINARLAEWLKNNTEIIKQKVPAYLEAAKIAFQSMADIIKVLVRDVATLGKFLFQLPTGIKLAAAAALLLSSGMARVGLVVIGIEAAIKTFPLLWRYAIELNSRAVLLMMQGVNKVIAAMNKIPGINIGKIDTSGQEALIDTYANLTIEAEKALEANKPLIQSMVEGSKDIKNALSDLGAGKFDAAPASPASPVAGVVTAAKDQGKKTVEAWRKAMNEFKVVTDTEMKDAALAALENFSQIEKSGQLTGKRLAGVWNKQVGPDLMKVFDTLDADTQKMVLQTNKRFGELAETGKQTMATVELHGRDAMTRLRGPFTDFFDSANQGFMNLQSLAGNVVSVIRRKLAELAADKAIGLLTNALFPGSGGGGGGGLLSGIFGGVKKIFGFHEGGVVGSGGSPRQLSFVPRLHSGGIAGVDEVPAVLQKGEGVLSRKGMANLERLNLGNTGGGGGITVLAPVTIQVSAIDTQSGIAFVSRPENLDVIGGHIRQTIIGNGRADFGL